MGVDQETVTGETPLPPEKVRKTLWACKPVVAANKLAVTSRAIAVWRQKEGRDSFMGMTKVGDR